MKKLSLLIGVGIGYVLGTRAGRERYDQMRDQAQKVAHDPRVQSKAQQVGDAVKDHAPVVKEKVSDAASTVASKVRPNHDDEKPSATASTTTGVGATVPVSETSDGPDEFVPSATVGDDGETFGAVDSLDMTGSADSEFVDTPTPPEDDIPSSPSSTSSTAP